MADVLTIDELAELPARFGMKAGSGLAGAPASVVSAGLVTVGLVHALAGSPRRPPARAYDSPDDSGDSPDDSAGITLCFPSDLF